MVAYIVYSEVLAFLVVCVFCLIASLHPLWRCDWFAESFYTVDLQFICNCKKIFFIFYPFYYLITFMFPWHIFSAISPTISVGDDREKFEFYVSSMIVQENVHRYALQCDRSSKTWQYFGEPVPRSVRGGLQLQTPA